MEEAELKLKMSENSGNYQTRWQEEDLWTEICEGCFFDKDGICNSPSKIEFDEECNCLTKRVLEIA